MVVKTQIIKIGNSQGIRIPKWLLEQLGFQEEVELEIEQDKLVIRSSQKVREGWDLEFRRMAERKEDYLIDGDIQPTTKWDEEEWEW